MPSKGKDPEKNSNIILRDTSGANHVITPKITAMNPRTKSKDQFFESVFFNVIVFP